MIPSGSKQLLAAGSKIGGALSSVIGLAAKSPLAAETVAGAGAGFITSGFSGWGALAGATGGLVGGSVGAGRGASGYAKKTPAPRLEVVGKSLTKGPSVAAGGMAMPKTKMGSMGYGRTMPGTMSPGGSIGYAQTMPGTMVGAGATFGAAQTMPGTLVGGRTMNQGRTLRGTVSPVKPMAVTGKKTMAGGWGITSDLDQVRGIIAESQAAHQKALGSWNKGQRRAAFSGRMKGAAIGGAIGGITALGVSTVGSAFGSNNRQPYGTTFSGMGNGTVRGY